MRSGDVSGGISALVLSTHPSILSYRSLIALVHPSHSFSLFLVEHSISSIHSLRICKRHQPPRLCILLFCCSVATFHSPFGPEQISHHATIPLQHSVGCCRFETERLPLDANIFCTLSFPYVFSLQPTLIQVRNRRSGTARNSQEQPGAARNSQEQLLKSRSLSLFNSYGISLGQLPQAVSLFSHDSNM
ncbi:hypothetical protein BC939DRAFT_173602 [Gamsiella multidivaricata]|uniref:uncharacterized protein n=1 Tax=Gamsiella multidivaricata TaxID=101098 RepID=UPI00221FCE35|nr:uncharacterized protein BC939DRAFT_173602 [Gamsiella multidivaricata]KAI7822921.1 hypothetical protein BC939DRAFT_173602 [Gamsiella multidivaricata]